MMDDPEEDNPRDERHRVPTEKGLNYQLEVKERERGRLLRNLEGRSRELAEILSSDYEIQFVKERYSGWLNDYERLLESHSAFQKLLDAETAALDQVSFNKNCANCLKVKSDAESWFLSLKPHPDDLGSFISRRSNVSNVSSHVSIERMKEGQRKAELMARQSSLKEKQRLEEEKLRLKLKEEELALETELKVSDAKSRILEDLEKSIVQDSGLIFTETQPLIGNFGMNKNELTMRNLEDSRTSRGNNQTLNMVTVSRELNKPRAEITKFYGSPLDYTRFKRQFHSRVDQNTDSYDERLNFLLQFTAGEANKIVTGYSNLPAEIGYRAAFEEFEERYGDSDLIAQTYVKKVLDWPQVKADDPKALDEFAIFLRECQYAVESVEAARILEYSENLRSIIQKLPFYLHDKWRNVVYDHKVRGSVVKFETLVSFIRKEAKKATDPIYGKEMLASKQAKTSASSPSRSEKGKKGSKALTTVVKESNEQIRLNSCTYCKGEHNLSECMNISLNALTDRFAFLKTNGLCFGCLRAGHLKGDCRRKLKCAKCKRLHPTILHVDPRQPGESQSHGNPPGNIAQPDTRTCAAHTGAGAALPVVPVRLKAKTSDKYIETYAFLDSGSTATFCSERILALLGVEGRKMRVNMVTLSDNKAQELREVTGLEISSLDGDNTVELPPVFTQRTLPISRTDIPSEEDIASWPHLRSIQLDRINSEVDLLIGVNVPKAMEPWDLIPSENSGPFAIKTLFGWVVNGPLIVTDSHRTVKSNYVHTTLDDQLRDHFNRDFSELTINDKPEHSREDLHFLESVTHSITKCEGHFTVDLPFKSKNVNMPNNFSQAKQRLSLLSKRFDKDARFRDAYRDFMKKIIDRGYAERVSPNDIPNPGKVWYLPHHGVFHPKKGKIRVVFDCAARYGGTSLNDQLLQGPNLTNSLVGTLMRFRQEPVALMGDIECMFYQVNVSHKDRNFQRFLWWEGGDTDAQPIEYQMGVHLFGATSSPSCASFALQQTTKGLKGNFGKEAADTIVRNFYVDDCLKSVETEQAAVSLIKDLQAILKGGGFRITKWVSNSRKVMESVPASERAEEVRNLDLDDDKLPIERTLGLNWSIELDVFSFTVDVKSHAHTRRGILSTISSIYDPLGFISPMIVNAKSMLQELCRLQLSWDEPIPETYEKKWCKWLDDIKDLRNFEVDRCFKPSWFGAVVSSELHHFADASEKGYGTVTYLRLTNLEGKVHCAFIIGKSRVAPLKKVTIPRLELTAATVAVRVDKMLKQELDLKIDRTFFWTDSMSVLRYIQNSTSRFHTFVANRLNLIHEASNREQWCYVSSKQNPADIASRGMPINQDQWRSGWIEAPPFLFLSEESWPTIPQDIHKTIPDDPELKKALVNSAKVEQSHTDCIDQLINHYSSWYKLKRSVAWILKFKEELLLRARGATTVVSKGIKSCKIAYNLTTEDLKKAEAAVVAYVQRQAFSKEIQALEVNQSNMKGESRIRKLDPILEDGILRVGGRLHKSSMPA